MQMRRQDRDVAGDFAQPVILHQHLAELAQRVELVAPVHRRARVDDMAQRGMVGGIDAWMLGQQLQNRRHGEHVGDAPARDQAPSRAGIEAVALHQHALGAARDLRQQMDARAMRQRRDDERGVGLARSGHQVAEVVGDDEPHLPVRQHRRLRPARGARREEEPARIVMDQCDVRCGLAEMRRHQRVMVRPERRRADGDQRRERRRGLAGGLGMVGEIGVAEHRARAAGGGEMRHLLRGLTEIGGHPDRAKAETGEHGLDHLHAVLRLHQHPVALGQAKRRQRRRQRVDARVNLAPRPCARAAGDADMVGEAPRAVC